METVRQRPIGVTLLAVLAGIVAVLAGLHFLQAVGVLPYVVGPVSIRDFNLWYTLMWGLTLWVWVWLVRMLWRVEPGAWIFLVVVSSFNLMLDFVALIGTTTVSDLSLSFLLNAAILAYALLPGTREAFNVPT
jgi:hypothetical protein